MSDTPIADAVLDALSRTLSETSGAIPTGYVLLAATINEDGTPGLVITTAPGQATHVSLGMLAYADEWFRDDVRFQINALETEDE